MALVVNNGHELSIMSLHDGSTGQVSVLVGNDEIRLRAGELVIISDDPTASLKQANPVPEVALLSVSFHSRQLWLI